MSKIVFCPDQNITVLDIPLYPNDSKEDVLARFDVTRMAICDRIRAGLPWAERKMVEARLFELRADLGSWAEKAVDEEFDVPGLCIFAVKAFAAEVVTAMTGTRKGLRHWEFFTLRLMRHTSEDAQIWEEQLFVLRVLTRLLDN